MKMQAKDLNYYLALPYTIVLRRDEEGDLVARIEELQGCTAHGATAQEAVECLEDQKKVWITDAIEAGDAIPEPQTQEILPSGKWVQRVTRSLHAKITAQAKREGVSLNQYVATVLAESVGKRWPITQASYPHDTGVLRIMSNALAVSADIHGAWTVDTKVHTSDALVHEVKLSNIHVLAETVRLFASRVPERFTKGLKAMQSDAAKQNIKLEDA
jgi:antitoxin HicB